MAAAVWTGRAAKACPRCIRGVKLPAPAARTASACPGPQFLSVNPRDHHAHWTI